MTVGCLKCRMRFPGRVSPDTVFEKFVPSQHGGRSDLDSGRGRCLVSRRTNGSVDARSAAKILTGCPARFGDAGAGADCRLLGGRPGRCQSAVCHRHLPQRQRAGYSGRPRWFADRSCRCLRAVLPGAGQRVLRFAAARDALRSLPPRRTRGVARGGRVRCRCP